jgi:hypothetical protein
LQIKTKNVSCHTADSKPVKQEVNGTTILPPLVLPAQAYCALRQRKKVFLTLAPEPFRRQHPYPGPWIHLNIWKILSKFLCGLSQIYCQHLKWRHDIEHNDTQHNGLCDTAY